MTDRERLIELFEAVEKDPAITCPHYKTDKTCDTCKYTINNFMCNHTERMIDYLLANGVKLPVRCKDCKDYAGVTFDGKPMHYGYCCNTHDDVVGSKHRYEGDFCSYGWLKECEGK